MKKKKTRFHPSRRRYYHGRLCRYRHVPHGVQYVYTRLGFSRNNVFFYSIKQHGLDYGKREIISNSLHGRDFPVTAARAKGLLIKSRSQNEGIFHKRYNRMNARAGSRDVYACVCTHRVRVHNAYVSPLMLTKAAPDRGPDGGRSLILFGSFIEILLRAAVCFIRRGLSAFYVSSECRQNDRLVFCEPVFNGVLLFSFVNRKTARTADSVNSKFKLKFRFIGRIELVRKKRSSA